MKIREKEIFSHESKKNLRWFHMNTVGNKLSKYSLYVYRSGKKMSKFPSKANERNF